MQRHSDQSHAEKGLWGDDKEYVVNGKGLPCNCVSTVRKKKCHDKFRDVVLHFYASRKKPKDKSTLRDIKQQGKAEEA